MNLFIKTDLRGISMLVWGMIFPFLLQAQEWKNYTPANSPVTDIEGIRDIAVDPVRNDVWIAAGTFLYERKKDGSWITYEAGKTPGLSYAGCVEARNGIVWVGPRHTQGNQLSYFNGTVWQAVTIPNATFSDIMDIEIAEAFVWVASDRGLFQYDGQAWKKLDYNGRITQPTSVSWDATSARLWIANNCVSPGGNVFRHNPADGSWKEYETGTGRCGHAVQALPDGSAYYGSCNYSSILSIKNEQVSSGIKSGCVYLDGVVLNPLAEGEVWFSTEFNYANLDMPWGLVRYDGSSVVSTFNFKNSAMKGGGIEAIGVQKTNDATAVVWMKTYKYDPNASPSTTRFLETYTYTAAGNALLSFEFLEPPAKATIAGDEITALLPQGTDVSALKAVFTASPGAIVKAGDVVQTSGVTPNDFRAPITYTVVSTQGETRNYSVSAPVTGSSFLSFQFLAPAVIANIEGTEIALELPRNTDLSSLIAVFTVSPGATVKVGDVVQSSGVTANDFRAPVMYTVTGAYGEVSHYQASVSIITGVEDNNTMQAVQVFPVPAKDHFTVKIQEGAPRQMPLKLTLYSVLGEVIAERELHDGADEAVFNTAGLKGSMALLRVGSRVFKISLGRR